MDDAPASVGQREADRALGAADASLEQAHHGTREVREAARELKRLGDRDDFAARIRQAMGGT